MPSLNSATQSSTNLKRREISGRWQRISQLTEAEEAELFQITEHTSGMTLYGNRARTSIMLPLDLAREISRRAKLTECTVNQVVVELLEQLVLAEKISVVSVETEH